MFDDADDSDLIAATARAASTGGPRARRQAVAGRSLSPPRLRSWPCRRPCSWAPSRGGWTDPPSRTRSPPTRPLRSPPSGDPDYVTGKGQKSMVDLPDGTRVTLDVDSAVDVAFTGGRRDARFARTAAASALRRRPRPRPSVRGPGGRAGSHRARRTQFDVQLTSALSGSCSPRAACR
ncbi:FecR domain-containing protein [Caulobacter segnis]